MYIFSIFEGGIPDFSTQYLWQFASLDEIFQVTGELASSNIRSNVAQARVACVARFVGSDTSPNGTVQGIAAAGQPERPDLGWRRQTFPPKPEAFAALLTLIHRKTYVCF